MAMFISEEDFVTAKKNIEAGEIYEAVQKVNAGGKIRTIIQRVIPIKDNTGKLLRILFLVFPDDTEELRQNMEEMQTTQEELSRAVAESEEKGFETQQFNNAILATCNVNEFSADFILTDINDNLLRFFPGLTKNDFVGKPLSLFVGEEAFKATKKAVEEGRIHEEIQNVQTGDGKTQTFIDRFVPICGKDGKLQRVLMLAFPDDTAELRQSEEELRQNMEEMIPTQEAMSRSENEFRNKKQWYESLLDAFDTPVSVTDMNGVVTFFNKAALDMLGKTPEEVVGKTCADCWQIENCHTDKCGYQLLKQGINKSYFNVGDQRFMSQASYLKDSNGNNVGHIEIISNVTETKQ
jgi:PAS domain S-box-containing protein